MLTLKNITKSFGETVVLDRINLSLGTREVIGLIGPNGAGKTTLLRLIQGAIEPDEGTIYRASENVAYLPQHFSFGSVSVRQYLASQLPDEYAEWKLSLVLEKTGLAHVPLSQSADSLSGGQKTRIGLAGLLLADPAPTVLLLDEPTNNLDTAGLVWLQNFVRQFAGSVLLTSHDRAFLDATVQRIAELEAGMLQLYGGNYSFYRQQKQLEREAQAAQYAENQEERRRLEHAIAVQQQKGQHAHSHMRPRPDNDKFARDFFQNRVTRKFGQQARALEARLEQIGTVEKPQQRKGYAVTLAGTSDAHKLIAEAENITKQYGDKIVLQDITFTIRGADRVWLSGPNGAGKSTLLNIVAGRLQPDNGSIKIGDNVRIGYFSQGSNDIDATATGSEILLTAGTPAERCYRQAMSLHLSEMDLKKPVEELSRGQVAKLNFAKLLLQENQLLILDEPTNHLEIETREDIEEALQDYQGAILVASHDRYFVDSLHITHELVLAHGQANWRLV